MTVSVPSTPSQFHPPEWWERLKLAFEAAADAPESERETILNGILGADAELLREVESLLEADRRATDFLDRSAAEVLGQAAGSTADDASGQIFGDYVAERKLGHGGMGVVYLARRRGDAPDNRVAVKVVRQGFDNPQVADRFRKERQILSRLVHPNIARVFDGGTADDGRPFFVMEFVDGLPLDEYCRLNDVDLNGRLQLFLKICAAVAYAHQNLVVHRDLKPHNVLVTADGTPKLLDFGIAKLLDDSAQPSTITDLRMLTPDYASPEQILGLPITTATDVYSLGILLYELLTATRPYRVSGNSPHELVRAISEAVPPRPSTAAAAAHGGIAARRLRGDLDNIVLMALRKEPVRRYDSVQHFAEDIERYLDGRPVKARTDSFAYRTSKFVRRNAATVTAGVALLLSLSGGIFFTLRMERRAEAERTRAEQQAAIARATSDDLRRLTHTLLFDLHDQIAAVPGAMRARQTLAHTALNYLDILARAAKDDPSLEGELARAYDTVGSITFTVRDAIASHSQAATIARTIVGRHPHDAAARARLAAALEHLGDALKVGGDYERAEPLAREAMTIAEQLWNSGLHTNDLRWLLMEIYGTRLELLDRRGEDEESAGIVERLLALGDEARTSSRGSVDAQRLYAGAQRLAGRHAAAAGDYRESLARYLRSAGVVDELARRRPSDARIRRELWSNEFGRAAALSGLGRYEEADAEVAKAIETIQSLATSDSIDSGHRRTLAITLRLGGDVAARRRDYERAAALYARSAELSSQIVEADSSNAESREDLAETMARQRKVVELERWKGRPPRDILSRRERRSTQP